VRRGRCQPLGSFLCMNRGNDTCRYDGNSTLVGQPECKCRPGFAGTWCEVEQEETKEVEQEGLEPRNSGTDIINGQKESAKDIITETTSQAVTSPTEENNEQESSTTKKEIKETVLLKAENDVDSGDVDWSKKSETLTPEKHSSDLVGTKQEIETTVPSASSPSRVSIPSKAASQDNDVSSEFGVRAIHSDVFNSGKLIEHFGSEEGLQGFRDY